MSNTTLIIDSYEDTPTITLEKGVSGNRIKIAGTSMPENAFEFYDSLLKKFIDFFGTFQNTELDIKIEYMNSMSNKQLVKLIVSCYELDKQLLTKWQHAKDDDLIKMKGEEIRDIYPNINIQLEEY